MFSFFRTKSKTCPNCHLGPCWDGYRCIRCGYIERLAKKTEILTNIMDLFDPQTCNPENLYSNKQLIPERPGVYAWYFDNQFCDYLTQRDHGFLKIDIDSICYRHWYLLYVGIAGKKKGRTLRDRIYTEHLTQNSKGSTLRQSLAALLWKEIDLDASQQLKGEKERMKLNNWIFRHAMVAWTETTNPEDVENLILHEFGHFLPLNVENNKKNPHIKKLKQLRESWRKGK